MGPDGPGGRVAGPLDLDHHRSLAPYVPRLVVGWAEAAPGKRWRTVEGTLVVVDISGLAALTRCLTEPSPIRPDELAAAVSAYFTRLLSVVDAAGGTVLKFSGERLVLLFEGVAGVARACRAAREMQSAGIQAGELPTPSGTVRLGMAVGVQTGTIDVFRVGTSHRELVVAGPAVSTAVAMAAVADPGEILVGPDCAIHLSPLVGDTKGPGFLLRHPSLAGIGGEPRRSAGPPDGSVDLCDSIPTALRHRFLSGATDPSCCMATIGCVRFEGVDGLLTAVGRAGAAAAIDDLVDVVQRIADSEGITFLTADVAEDGGRIILVAGAPDPLADDEARMRGLLQNVIAAPGTLPVRVGIHRGAVFAGELGAPDRRTYAVIGDAVRVATAMLSKLS